jgi:hypothetical protein
MANVLQSWKEYQVRDARMRVAILVSDAVIRYNPPCDNRRPFWRLHQRAGYVGGVYEDVLRSALAVISNG